MAKTRSMTRNQNDNAFSRKRFKICDNNGPAPPWSDINCDMLFLVIMHLGVVDFLAFGGVCKSWRSFALDNRKKYMVSRPPMSMHISSDSSVKDKDCYLEDVEGRRFKTTLPHSAGRRCVALTCGYLVLFGRKTHDFWLVNPITRRELHFPSLPPFNFPGRKVRAILMFSSSISRSVFVFINEMAAIYFSIEGQETWKHVSSAFTMVDIVAFKGKIYAIGIKYDIYLFELTLDPQPKLMLLKTESPNHFGLNELVSTGENLYLIEFWSKYYYNIQKLDFEEMKWVLCEKRREECAVFHSKLLRQSVVVKPELWVDQRFACTEGRLLYFPHECLNLNFIN